MASSSFVGCRALIVGSEFLEGKASKGRLACSIFLELVGVSRLV